jgi:hypothetical protein
MAVILRFFTCALMVSALSLALGASHASAFCQGLGCLPGSGYTVDRTWDCGQIHSEVNCFYNGVTSRASAGEHTWGFGSAAYNGEGSTTVRLDASTSTFSFFGGAGTNLIRACFNDNCDDQDSTMMDELVGNSGFHTIFGHGEA